MPENETVVSASPTQETVDTNLDQQQSQVNMDDYIRSNMEMRFGNGASDNNQQQDNSQQQQVNQDTPSQPVLIPIDAFKEYGFENQDSIVEAIKEYKILKATPPPQPPPIKFENEESEKYFNAAIKGDRKALREFLNEQDRLEQYANAEVDEKTADEILKLDLQVKYKDVNLSSDEINRLFSRQYNIPKEPIQGDLEDDTDFAIKKAAWQEQVNDIVAQKILDAKIAKPNIVAAKANLKFPELNNTADEGYAEYQKYLAQSEQIDAEDREAYKPFTPEQIKIAVAYVDEKNGVKVNYDFQPDAEGLNEAKAMASDVNLLFKSFIGQDGKPDRKAFLEFIYYGKNKEKAIMEAIKQAKTETIISKLPDNTQGSFNRQPAQSQQVSAFDEQMKRAFSLWGGQQQSRVG